MGTPHNITSEIDLLDTSMEFISLQSWMKDGVRRSQKYPDAPTFNYWLPLYLSSQHWRKAQFYSKKGISGICCGSPQRFRPPMVLRALPGLLHRFVVRIAVPLSRNEQITDEVFQECLYGYFSVHRTYLEYFKILPKLGSKLLSRVALFTDHHQPRFQRNKEKMPNILPTFVAAFSAFPWLVEHHTDCRRLFEWDFSQGSSLTYREAWFDEFLSRSVFWWFMLWKEKKRQSLKNTTFQDFQAASMLDVDSVELFELLKAPFLTIALHVAFFRKYCSNSFQETVNEYDSKLSCPSDTDLAWFKTTAQSISEIDTLKQFLSFILLSSHDQNLSKSKISEAFDTSQSRGYHLMYQHLTEDLTIESKDQRSSIQKLEDHIYELAAEPISLLHSAMEDTNSWIPGPLSNDSNIQGYIQSIIDEYNAEHPFPEGLVYVPEFITKDQEKQLIEHIDNAPWSQLLSRRVQHYGYRFDYEIINIDRSQKIDWPSWCQHLVTRIEELQIAQCTGHDQVTVNEYYPGQGIAPHVDSVDTIGDGLASLSLGSGVTMDFQHVTTGRRCSVYLEPRSIVVMNGVSRYEWNHSIAKRKNDIISCATVRNASSVLSNMKKNCGDHASPSDRRMVIPRDRRVSLTFRKVIFGGKRHFEKQLRKDLS